MRHVRLVMTGVFVAGGFLLGAAVLRLLAPTQSASADQTCTIAWAGPTTGGAWATAANWSPARVPTAGDVVCIGQSGPSVTGTVTYDGSNGTDTTLIAELRSSAMIDLTGGELGLTDTAATDNTVGGLTVAGGNLGDETNDQGSLTDTGAFTWSGGSIEAPTAQSPQPTVTDTSTSAASAITDPLTNNNWALTFAGPLGVSGSFYMQNGAAITESGTATLASGTDVDDTGVPGPFTVTPTGTLTMAPSATSATVGLAVDSTGLVSASSGTLNLGGGPSATGSLTTFSVASGATLALSRENVTGGTNSGAGTLSFSGTDTAFVSLDVANLTVNGSLTVKAALDLAGTATLESGELYLDDATNTVGGLSVAGGNLGDETNDQGSVTDTGAFNWSSGDIEAPTAQDPQPTVTVTSTTATQVIADPYTENNWGLDLPGALAISGDFYMQNGATITVSGTATLASGANVENTGGSGPFTVTSTGTLTLAAAATTATVGLAVNSTGVVSVPTGTLTLGQGTGAAGSITTFTVPSGATLDLNQENVNGGTNSGAGTVVFSDADTVSVPLDVANLVVAGGTTTVTAALDLDGTATLDGGELYLDDATNTVGGLSVAGGTLGDETNDQGSVTDTGAFNWSSGDIEAPSAQDPQPTVTVSSTTATQVIADPYTENNWGLDLPGALAISGDFYMQNGATITVSGTATLASGTNVENTGGSGPFTVTSTGTLTLAAAATTATVGLTVVNQGSVTDPGGTLTLGSLTNAASLSVGTATVVLDSAYAPGSGSTTAVTVAGTTAGVTYGQLQVTGTVTPGGTLAVTDGGAFTPTPGQSFQVISSSGATSGMFHQTTTGAPAGVALVQSDDPTGLELTATGPAADLSATAGSPQSATVGTAFAVDLAVTVTDSHGDPEPGVAVTFSAPASGAGASFAAGGNCTANPSANVCVATTDAGGVATASTLTADASAGSYAVSATSGALTAASFDLTNQSAVVAPPTVTAVVPSAGSTAGGTPVTVNGTNLGGATAVHFGADPAQGPFDLVSSTELIATSPAESAATVDITVTTPAGTSGTTAADQFSFVAPPPPNPYNPLPPARICDTRSGGTKAGCAAGATLSAGSTLLVQAEGQGGVPASAVSAVVVNVTVTNTTAASHLTLYPTGETEPTASNLNWAAHQTVPNLVTVGLSPSGAFDASNFAGSADVIVDVEGYYGSAPAGSGLYNALADPARICDTRAGNPSSLSGVALTQCQGRAPGAGRSLEVDVDSLGGVPASGVGAVILNVTAVGASSSGYLTVYPAGISAPLASNVNYTAGENVPNRVIVPVGTGSDAGEIDIYSSAGSPQLLVDVAGWFTDDSNASATGDRFTFAPAPTRVCDTRSGLSYSTQCTGHTLAAGVPLGVTVDGIEGIPAGVDAVVLNVTVANTSAQSHLTVYPAGQSLPSVSDLNWTAGKVVPNFTVATVGTGGQVELDNFAGSTDVIVDVVGWYAPAG